MLIKTMPEALEQAAVHLRAPSGRMKPFRAAADTDLARGQALFDAWQQAQTGDCVLLGPGLYDLQFKNLANSAARGIIGLGTQPLIRVSDHFFPLLAPAVAEFLLENVYLWNIKTGGSHGHALHAGSANEITIRNSRLRGTQTGITLANTAVRLRIFGSRIEGIPLNAGSDSSATSAIRLAAGCEGAVVELYDSICLAEPNTGECDAISAQTGTLIMRGGLARGQNATATRCTALRANIVSGSNPVFDVGGGARLEAESGIANNFVFAGAGTWRFGDVQYDPAKIGTGAGLAVDFNKFTSTVKTLRRIDSATPGSVAGTPGELVQNATDGKLYQHVGGSFALAAVSRIQDATDFAGPPSNNHFVKFDGTTQTFVTAAIDIEGGILNIADAEDFSGSAVAGTMFHTGGAFITAGPTWDGTNSRVVFANNHAAQFGANGELRIRSDGTNAFLDLKRTGASQRHLVQMGTSTALGIDAVNFVFNVGATLEGLATFRSTLYMVHHGTLNATVAVASDVSPAVNVALFEWIKSTGIGRIHAGQNGLQVSNGPTSKLAFYGATPINRPAAIANATEDLAEVTSQLNGVLAALRALGLIAT